MVPSAITAIRSGTSVETAQIRRRMTSNATIAARQVIFKENAQKTKEEEVAKCAGSGNLEIALMEIIAGSNMAKMILETEISITKGVTNLGAEEFAINTRKVIVRMVIDADSHMKMMVAMAAIEVDIEEDVVVVVSATTVGKPVTLHENALTVTMVEVVVAGEETRETCSAIVAMVMAICPMSAIKVVIMEVVTEVEEEAEVTFAINTKRVTAIMVIIVVSLTT